MPTKWSTEHLKAQSIKALQKLEAIAEANATVCGETCHSRARSFRWARRAGAVRTELDSRKPALYVALAPNGKPYQDTFVCGQHLAEFIADYNSEAIESKEDSTLKQSDFVVSSEPQGCLYCSMKPGLQAEF
jgi:hypothetical protein